MSDAGKGPHLLTARDGSQALCGGPGACPACEYDKRIAAADEMAKALTEAVDLITESYTRPSMDAGYWPTVKPIIERLDAALDAYNALK